MSAINILGLGQATPLAPLCGRLIHSNDREIHALIHQVEGRPFVCGVCDGSYRGSNAHQLYDHIRLQHPTACCVPKELVLCPVCQAMLTVRQLAKHVCADSFVVRMVWFVSFVEP